MADPAKLCRSCGTGLPSGALFCPKCGTQQDSTPQEVPTKSTRVGWIRRIPGFRSGNPAKVLVAVLGYLAVAETMSAGLSQGQAYLVLFGLLMLLFGFIWANAWGLRDAIPLVSSRSRGKAILGWTILAFVALIAVGSITPPTSTGQRVANAPTDGVAQDAGVKQVSLIAPTSVASTKQPTATTVPTATSVPPTSTPVPSTPTTAPRIKDTIVKGNWAYSVVGVSTQKTVTWSAFGNKTAAKGTWLLITMALMNGGDKTMAINEWDFELKDDHGRTYGMDTVTSAMFDSYNKISSLGEQIPPGVATGVGMLYDVNPDAKGFRLYLKQAGEYVDLVDKEQQ